MDPRPFRPAVAELESRLVPAADPAAVVAAYTATVTSADDLYFLATHLERGRTDQAIATLRTQLPQVAAQSRANAAVLSGYRRELQAAAAANPGLGESFQQFLMQVAGAEVQAQLNGVYADFMAVGFGAPPPVPPPPPPPPDSSPVFGVDTTSAATTAATTPTTPTTTPASTLPFSLSDPNFRTQADGTRVWDVTPGTGATVTTGSPVTVHYTGFLTDGTKFDSSLDRGTPLVTTLTTSNLIPGFVSGVSGMQVGGTRRIFIPSALGYGGVARTGIPANSDLVFEVQLVSTP